jgi:CheY-like chemotaxis protein
MLFMPAPKEVGLAPMGLHFVQKSSCNRSQPMSEPRERERILILNDDPKVLDLAKSAVEEGGYQAIVTTSESEAEAILRAGGADVFVQDLERTAGNVGGERFFRMMQQDEQLSRIPKVCFSAHAPTGHLAHNLAKWGVDGYVSPIPHDWFADEFRAEIRTVLELCKSERPPLAKIPDPQPREPGRDAAESDPANVALRYVHQVQEHLHHARGFRSSQLNQNRG